MLGISYKALLYKIRQFGLDTGGRAGSGIFQDGAARERRLLNPGRCIVEVLRLPEGKARANRTSQFPAYSGYPFFSSVLKGSLVRAWSHPQSFYSELKHLNAGASNGSYPQMHTNARKWNCYRTEGGTPV